MCISEDKEKLEFKSAGGFCKKKNKMNEGTLTPKTLQLVRYANEYTLLVRGFADSGLRRLPFSYCELPSTIPSRNLAIIVAMLQSFENFEHWQGVVLSEWLHRNARVV